MLSAEEGSARQQFFNAPETFSRRRLAFPARSFSAVRQMLRPAKGQFLFSDMPEHPSPYPTTHPRTMGWIGTTALAMGGSNQSLFLIGGATGLLVTQGSAAAPLLVLGLLLSWAALPGWVELVLMWPNRVGGISATCAEAFRPISPVLANLTGVCYWWGWVPTCGLTAILSATAIHTWYLPGVPITAMAIGIVVLFTAVNLLGIRWVVRLATPIAAASATLAFLSGILPVIAGEVDWRQASDFHLVTPFPGFFGELTSTMAGLYLIGFAAPAFEQAACHVGETIDPVRNVRRAMFASAWMATLYFLVLPVVWLGVLGPKTLTGDLQNILGPTFAPLFGQGARAAAIWFMMFNMFHGTLAPLAGAARTLSQLAEDGLLPEVLARRNRFDVPWVTTTGTASMAILFLLTGDPVWVIAAANLCYLIGIGMPSVAVWLLRRNAPEMARPYRAPGGTIMLGLLSAIVWGASAVFGLQQFGLPTVLAGIALAYSGSLLFAIRRWMDAHKRRERGIFSSLHLKLTGAMLLVLVFDGAGYLLAVSSVSSDRIELITLLEDIFVVVALLTISVGLVLPGIISHTVGEVSRAADRLATGTLADFSKAMQALATGNLDSAHARVDLAPVVVASRDEVGAMALSFNLMQQEVAHAAVGLDGAREGLRTMRDTLHETNARLEQQVRERTVALQAAQQAEERLQAAHEELETRVLERTAALADASREISVRALQQAAVAELGQRALISTDLAELMDAAAKLTVNTLHVEYASVLELSRDESELRLCASRGWAEDLIGKYVAPADRNSPAGYALLAREPVLVEDFQRETRFAPTPQMRVDGIQSAVLLSIGGKVSPFGVLGAYSTQQRKFTQDDVYFLQALANVLAAAIERKRAEEVIRESQQEAERANAAKSEFLSRMSHELRTPLNAILGFGQLLEMDALETRQSQSVHHILKAGRHLLTLIDEVLDVARIEAGRLDLAMESISINRVLNDVLALVRPLADQRNIRLDYLSAKEVARRHVFADEKRLRQVLLNLLSNAVKYNCLNGQVRIVCEVIHGGERLRIAVSDTGQGIPPEKLGQLFSPFERLGAEQTGIEGSGLGLALSKRLIEAQGGSIEAESRVGQGSTFAVTLPLADRTDQPAPPIPAVLKSSVGLPPIHEAAPPETGEPAKPRIVLYIEDNLSNLNLVESLLARQPGIELLAAMRGGAGLEMAVRHQPDVILLDLQLPDISGAEVLRQLRANPSTCNIPVVMISADAIPAQIDVLLAAGARDYITKPLEVKRFLRVLQDCFDTKKPPLVASANVEKPTPS
jgi:signal transduction histidine kinase/amino acid transporter/ActR/RegA family two-component response regulator